MWAIPLCFLSQRSAFSSSWDWKESGGGEVRHPFHPKAWPFWQPSPLPIPPPPPLHYAGNGINPRFGKISRLLAFDLEYSVIFSSYLTVLFKALSPSSLLPLQPLGDQAQKAQKDLGPWATSLSFSTEADCWSCAWPRASNCLFQERMLIPFKAKSCLPAVFEKGGIPTTTISPFFPFLLKCRLQKIFVQQDCCPYKWSPTLFK